MPVPEKLRSLTRRLRGPCPLCGNSHLIRKTRNANSPFMRWVKCPKEGCSFQGSMQDYMAMCVNPRRQKLAEDAKAKPPRGNAPGR